MKRPRLPALKSWSAGQLSLLILAGILSVWVMGAIAFGFVSNLNSGVESALPREEPTTTTRNLESEQGAVAGPETPRAAPTPAAPPVVPPANFSIECTNPGGIPRGSEGGFNCLVRSRAGFSQDVSLTCANFPRGMSCEARPTIVKSEPNGTATFRLLIANYGVSPGRHVFKIVGSTPDTSVAYNFPFDTSVAPRAAPAVSPAPTTPRAPARVEIQCETGSTSLIPGQSISYQCTYSSQNFAGSVDTRCSGTGGIACEMSPGAVTTRPGQPVNAALVLRVAPNISSAGANQVIGVYGDPQGAPPAIYRFTVDVPLPDYALSCAQKTVAAGGGTPVSVRCTVSSTSGYVAPFHLKLVTIDPNGPGATLDRATVQVGARGSAEVNVTFAAAAATAPGNYRYALGVHADEKESFPPSTGDTPRNVVITVTVPEPPPSPSPSPSPTLSE